jgi:putative FmdB family regulatory protein
MAMYEYVCEPCDIVREVRHGMSERPSVPCTECGMPMERSLGATPFKPSPGMYSFSMRSDA